MRKLATLANKKDLKVLEGYLYYHSIETFNYEDPEDLNLWVVKDTDKEKAKSLFLSFEKIYLKKEGKAGELEKLLKNAELGASKFDLDKRLEEEKEKKSQVIDARKISSSQGGGFRFFSVTGVLILLSTIIFLWANSYKSTSVVYRLLLISRFPKEIFFLFEVSQGEFWRLITPIFIHGGIFHILFNMMWLYQLGRLIEDKEGSLFYGFFVFLVALVSNFVFYLVIGPHVGGMSGVVYGIVGYLWAYRRIAPMSAYLLDEGLLRFFFIWYLISWGLTLVGSGFGFGIANTVHGMGAFVGILLGALRAYSKEEGVLPPSRLFTKEGLLTLGTLAALLLGGMLVDMFSQGLLR